MVKTKAYAEHTDVDNRAGQPGDISWWQREMFKSFVAGGGLDSDILAQPYFSSMPLHYPQHLWSHPLFQQFAHPAMPQSPAPMHEQEKEHDSQENGAKRSPANKANPSCNCETPGSSAGAGCHPYHKSAGDSNYDDFYNMGGTRPPPYSYPGGYMSPMPPHPGQLDQLMCWMQYMRQKAAYLQSTTGHRNGYQSPLPAPSGGPSQRGFIKVPSGVPQKQAQLWETQSSENVQLWATVTQLCASLARAEAEIFCQRRKIIKLEDDLEMMKTRQDALSEALKGRTVFSQTKRERRKRTAAVPVAILGLPASQPCLLRAGVKKARGIMNEGDPLKHANELASETNAGCTHQNLLNLSDQNGNGNCSMSVSLTETESRTDASDKDKPHGQHLTLSSCVDTVSPSRQENGSRSIGVNLPDERIRESHNLQNMFVKQECIIEPSAMAAERLMEGAESNSKQVLHSDDSRRDNETVKRNIVCIIAANEAQQRTDAADAGVSSKQVEMHKGGNGPVCSAMVSGVDSIPSILLPISNSLTRPSVRNIADMVAHGQTLLENSRMDAAPLGDEEAEAMNACSIDDFDVPDNWTEGGMEEVLE